MEGLIYIEDGTVYKGKGFGAVGTRVGELVFNTGMTGYQKTLTDPSYMGQIINMTYPLIGNYGINETDYESKGIYAFGIVAKDICFTPSNAKSIMNIDEWLKIQKTPGVWGIDTRKITKKIRNEGTLKCVISTEGISIETAKLLCERTALRGDYMKKTGVSEVTELPALCNELYNVAVMDFGSKASILTELRQRGCSLTLFPYGTKAEEILGMKPDGIFLTNGPGDPDTAREAVAEIRKLLNPVSGSLGHVPMFGICMGHQLIAQAVGGATYKMKFGHRGGNHGVFDKDTGKSYITSQNHGYAVRPESVVLKGMEVTHLNLNDGTVEGMKHINKPLFSVQFHPEASPGPMDTGYLFDKFIDMMKGGKE